MTPAEGVSAGNSLQRAQLKGALRCSITVVWHRKSSRVCRFHRSGPYLIEIPHSERQSSPRRVVRLPLAISVARDIQVHSVLNILLKCNNADMQFSMSISSFLYNLKKKMQHKIKFLHLVTQNKSVHIVSSSLTMRGLILT